MNVFENLEPLVPDNELSASSKYFPSDWKTFINIWLCPVISNIPDSSRRGPWNTFFYVAYLQEEQETDLPQSNIKKRKKSPCSCGLKQAYFLHMLQGNKYNWM